MHVESASGRRGRADDLNDCLLPDLRPAIIFPELLAHFECCRGPCAGVCAPGDSQPEASEDFQWNSGYQECQEPVEGRLDQPALLPRLQAQVHEAARQAFYEAL